MLFLDEFAFVPENVADEFQFCVSHDLGGQETKVLIISTPKGLNMYYKLWSDAIEKETLTLPSMFTGLRFGS